MNKNNPQVSKWFKGVVARCKTTARRAVCVSILLISALPLTAKPETHTPASKAQTLEEIRAQIDEAGYQFTVGHNWVFDLAPEQKSRFFGRKASGRMRAYSKTANPELLSRLADEPLPERFDWRSRYESGLDRNVAYIGPVRNQRNCGSCYAFGATAAAESAWNIAKGLYDDQAVDFSEGFLAFCLSAYYEGFDGCYGADYEYEEVTALVEQGALLESDMPYVADNPVCDPESWTSSRQRMGDWFRIPSNDIEGIKAAIYRYGVLDAAVWVTDAFQAYASGVYEDEETSCPDLEYTDTNHAIALVGWDDNPPEGGEGVWILRNSWGPNWGESGYMRIRYTSAAVACAPVFIVSGVWPEVSTAAATSVGQNQAVVSGTIMPTDAETAFSWRFQYGEAPTPDALQSTSGGEGAEDLVMQQVSETLTGLKPATTYYYRLQAGETLGEIQTLTTLPGPPEALTEEATDITSRSVKLNATLNPYNLLTHYYFEYGPTEAYGFVSATSFLETGNQSVPVSVTLQALNSVSEYHYRFVATNSLGTVYGADQSFTTLAEAPTVEEVTLTGVMTRAANFKVTLHPRNSETRLWFEYGEEDQFGQSSTTHTLQAMNEAATLFVPISGLSPSTTWYYRLIAENAGGISYGPSGTFTTAKSSSKCFIATAAYGSHLEPEVEVLRTFRDEKLAKTAAGRGFISLYYSLSPPVAEVIAHNERAREATRVILEPLVKAAKWSLEHAETP